MWNDPIVEETHRLRDEYAASHSYNIHAIVEDLKQWEQDGFPLAINSNDTIQPPMLSSVLCEPKDKDQDN